MFEKYQELFKIYLKDCKEAESKGLKGSRDYCNWCMTQLLGIITFLEFAGAVSQDTAELERARIEKDFQKR